MIDLSEIFTTENVNELSSSKELKDKSLLTENAALKAEEEFPIETEEITFTIGFDSGLIVQLFNDEDDKDELQLLNTDNEKGSNNEHKPSEPFLVANYANNAYLKYSFFVKPKTKLSGTLADIGFELEGDQIIETGQYTFHKNNKTLSSAVAGDIQNVKTIFKWANVKELGNKNAVYFATRGKLKSKVKVSWSDVLTKSLSSLTSKLGLPGNISLDLSLSPSFSASYSVEVTDDFGYVVTKNGSKYDVKVNKAISTDQSISADASIGVEFADKDELEEALKEIVDKIFESITGFAEEKFDQLVTKVKEGIGSASENATVSEIIERLDLEGESSPLDSLTSKLDKLKEKATEVVEDIAKASVKFSFAYEYQRISTKKELLLATFSEDTLSNYHGDFLKFRLSRFVSDYSDMSEEDVQVKYYVNEKEIEVKKSWGFDFTFGGKTIFKGKDFSEKKTTMRSNIFGNKQVALDSKRGYQSEFGSEEKWLASISSEMDNYSKTLNPTMQEFDYTMFVNIWRRTKVNKKEKLKRFLDLGVLWNAIDQSEVDRITDKYFDVLKQESKVSLEAKITFKKTAFWSIVMNVGSLGVTNPSNLELLSNAMAGGMEFFEEWDYRSSVTRRMEVYAPLWRFFLQNPDTPNSILKSTAINHFKKTLGISSSNAKRMEDLNFSFSDTLRMNPSTYSDLSAFMTGILELSRNIKDDTFYQDKLDRSVNDMKRFFEQSHYVRSLGAYLTSYVKQNTFLQNDVENILTITYGEGDDEKILTIAG